MQVCRVLQQRQQRNVTASSGQERNDRLCTYVLTMVAPSSTKRVEKGETSPMMTRVLVRQPSFLNDDCGEIFYSWFPWRQWRGQVY